jgi:hypothetical protein
LEAMANQENVQVDYIRSDIYGLDVLEPHNSARRNRLMLPIGERGHVWRNDDHTTTTPAVPARAPLREHKVKPKVRYTRGHDTAIIRSNYVPKRLAEIYNANTEVSEGSTEMKEIPVYDIPNPAGLSEAAALAFQQKSLGESVETKKQSEDTSLYVVTNQPLVTSEQDIASSEKLDEEATFSEDTEQKMSMQERILADGRPTSPKSSLEDGEDDAVKKGRIVRLDGEIAVPISMPPSYRYLYVGVEVGHVAPGRCPQLIHRFPVLASRPHHTSEVFSHIP